MFKWFSNLFDEEKEPINVEEEPEKESVEETVEPEKEPAEEMVNVEASGRFTFDVVEREEYYNFQSQYMIKFTYDVVVKFLDYEIPINRYFFIDPLEENNRQAHANGRTLVYLRWGIEDVYEYLASILEGERELIMERLKYNLASDIRKYIRDKNVAELEKYLKENNSFDIKISFEIKKDKRM